MFTTIRPVFDSTPTLPQVWIQDGRDGGWLHFVNPLQIVTATHAAEVLPALRELEQAVETTGLYAAGFLRYEAAPAFDTALRVHEVPAGTLPLLWFGLYSAPRADPLPPVIDGYQTGAWQPSVDAPAFAEAIAAIHAQIAAGAAYQVNYTFRLRASFAGAPYALFRAMLAAQQGVTGADAIGRYAAYLDLGRYAIACASPELFFRRDGADVTAQPMKGTAARGLTPEDDRALAAALRQSEKERAENVMIVDMIRNDLGRVARTGSVNVPSLFDVTRYPTLHQMTTTVSAQTDITQTDLLRALFPCASITGAPKVRTMQIIHALEPDARGVYTGAIGYLAPGRRAQFNVAIRTAVIDRDTDIVTYGVGSGVVWDSQAAREYAECLVKARVLTEPQAPFELLMALRWQVGSGYWLLTRHLARLLASADYFGFAAHEETVRAALAAHAVQMGLRADGAPRKVRLALNRAGGITLDDEPVGPGGPVGMALAPAAVDSQLRWLYHKTTQRAVYATARAAVAADDVLLWNVRGEVTETTTANVVFEIDGERVTPPVSSGLLAGTLRAELLARGVIRERVVTLDTARACRRWWLINGVRGWRPAYWVAP